jgi:hypothetical protein
MMKYRILCSDSDWLPNEGGGIKLWREDDEGRAVLPCGGPPALRAQSMRSCRMRIQRASIKGVTSICVTTGGW